MTESRIKLIVIWREKKICGKINSPLIFGHPIKDKICDPEKNFKKSSYDVKKCTTAHRDFKIKWRKNKLQAQHARFANKSRQNTTMIWLLIFKHELELTYDTANRILIEGNGNDLRQLINTACKYLELRRIFCENY